MHGHIERPVRIVSEIEPRDMESEDMIDEIMDLIVDCRDIERQLRDERFDPTERAEGWERRTKDARNHKMRRHDRLRLELIRRRVADIPAVDPDAEAARIDRQARHAELEASSRDRSATEDGRFVVAAKAILPAQQYLAIWARTKGAE